MASRSFGIFSKSTVILELTNSLFAVATRAVIKEYFANYLLHTSDVTLHMDADNHMEVHQRKNEPWKVTLVDTGDASQTGGRLGRVRSYLNGNSFCFTYGDGWRMWILGV